MSVDFSQIMNIEAYSATGKIHLRQQAENQKEHVICLAFPYSQKVVMHVNALRR